MRIVKRRTPTASVRATAKSGEEGADGCGETERRRSEGSFRRRQRRGREATRRRSVRTEAGRRGSEGASRQRNGETKRQESGPTALFCTHSPLPQSIAAGVKPIFGESATRRTAAPATDHSAIACENPPTLRHAPRVKSGSATGSEPLRTDASVSSVSDDHSAASYTS